MVWHLVDVHKFTEEWEILKSSVIGLGATPYLKDGLSGGGR